MAVVYSTDFETDLAHNVTWFSSTVTRDNGDAHAGSWSMLVACTGTPAATQLDNFPGFAVTGGASYDFACWVKESTATVGSCVWRIIFLDSAPANVGQTDIAFTPGGSWAQVAQTIVAPATAINVEWQFIATAPGSGPAFRVDDILIQDSAVGPAVGFTPASPPPGLSSAPFMLGRPLLGDPLRFGNTTPSAATDVNASDTAVGVDAVGALAVTVTASDTGTATDAAGALTVTLSAADTGTGTDVVAALSVPVTASDTATSTDATSALTATLIAADTAAGTDAGSVAATLTAADTGTTVDAGSVNAGSTPSASDTAAATDAVSALVVTLSASDTATATDAGTLASPVTASDTGTATDATSALAVTLSAADTGTGADFAAALARTAADVASGIDAGVVAVFLAAADTAAGVDAASPPVPVVPNAAGALTGGYRPVVADGGTTPGAGLTGGHRGAGLAGGGASAGMTGGHTSTRMTGGTT